MNGAPIAPGLSEMFRLIQRQGVRPSEAQVTDRRRFLKLISRTVVYQAPVILTLSTPGHALLQPSGMGMMMNNMMNMGMGMMGMSAEIGGPPPGGRPDFPEIP